MYYVALIIYDYVTLTVLKKIYIYIHIYTVKITKSVLRKSVSFIKMHTLWSDPKSDKNQTSLILIIPTVLSNINGRIGRNALM